MWTFVGSQVFWGRSQKHAQPHEEILHFAFPWLNSWAGRRLGTKAVPHPGAPCWDFSQGAALREQQSEQPTAPPGTPQQLPALLLLAAVFSWTVTFSASGWTPFTTISAE